MKGDQESRGILRLSLYRSLCRCIGWCRLVSFLSVRTSSIVQYNASLGVVSYKRCALCSALSCSLARSLAPGSESTAVREAGELSPHKGVPWCCTEGPSTGSGAGTASSATPAQSSKGSRSRSEQCADWPSRLSSFHVQLARRAWCRS